MQNLCTCDRKNRDLYQVTCNHCGGKLLADDETYRVLYSNEKANKVDIAFLQIEKELIKAKDKFPGWPKDPIHAAAVIAEESGELVQAALQFSYENGNQMCLLREACQVGAMAVRFIENLMEYDRSISEQIN